MILYRLSRLLGQPPIRRLTQLFILLCAGSLGATAGCFVRQKCYEDADCSKPSVCNAQGQCVFQCRNDKDCSKSFGGKYVCENNRCKISVECTLCSFPNAEAVCRLGRCDMGDCDSDFYDVNGDSLDGCEYPCVVSNDGAERCDEKDNDCDGKTDEDTDFTSDPEHCGACGVRCAAAPNAKPTCAFGQCTFDCEQGWYDNNGKAEDGCEASECIPAEEVCDGRDNDCDCPGDTNDDGIVCGPGDEGVDEGFDKNSVEHCGPYCTRCDFPHAEASCDEGQCTMGCCEAGWHDVDAVMLTGCEYRCTPSNDGSEVCDGKDNDCDGQTDEGIGCEADCPEDMVPVGSAYCIDRYEASRPDATETSAGTDESVAVSRADVLPWAVNPMTAEHFERFQTACRAAGKRLCTKEEWFACCTGPKQTYYVYGDDFDRETCNSVDTFCDDYCRDNNIASEECPIGSDCGYMYNSFHVVTTGFFSKCTNEYGTLDINGNLWETVPSDSDSRGYELRGGAFNCAQAANRVNCSFNATWSELYAGFRCCKDP
ncbi:MAG: SUMF1/EgtB/PvdO family nonheme iron enzyme [Deltaproteobacteria bacterium]|nr:SUMF1/EgtB/PvdO family nonheme iron enzyme [Deltaproteobacteria bacterium]